MSATLLRPSPGGSARTDRGLSGVGPQTIVKEGSTEVWQDENKAYIGDIPEFDAAGTELGKEARIWKIYVEQSDQWDAELVDGWNKSLDVILVFAALFSAISTAFIIESSKELRKDPPDAAVQALVLIPQILLTMTNNTHSLMNVTHLQPNPGNSTTPLPPSDTTVLVNTLWYLSLILSVLTSFMAMLAKDWCHSFMAGRTGHPYSQTHRRQQKWMMIEKWKMQELLIVLPSLIHLSLLLFTVGLCVYVWELNRTVAIPVVCVAALAASFYAWSSVAATLIDFFPYTTIVSRGLLSDPAKHCYTTLGSLLRYIWPLVRVIPDLGAQCLLLLLDFLYNHTARRSRSWKGFLKNQRDNLRQWASSLYLVPAPESRHKASSGEELITSLALSWLISNCEVPSAVDAALQAISGASHLDRRPLEESNAALEISRRLVSEDIYKQARSPRVLLYARALSYLSPNKFTPLSTPTGAPHVNPGEREVLIWSLQYANDKVANLITDGRFMPTKPNFEALRIGCTSAAQILTQVDTGRLSSSDFLGPLTKLLEEYVEDKQLLHPAALLALINSGFLLTICFPDSTELDIAGLALKLLRDKITYGLFGEPQLGISLVAYVILKAELALPNYSSQRNSRHREDSLHQTIKRLTQWSHYEKESIWLGVSVISSNPDHFAPQSQSTGIGDLREWAISSYHSTFECLPKQRESLMDRFASLGHLDNLINHVAVLEHLETLEEMYNSVTVGTPIPQIYYFVIESACRDRSSGYDIWETCGRLLSKFCFPALSTELVKWLDNEERNLIPLLWRFMKEHRKPTIKFLAASQFWYLYVLCSDPAVGTQPEKDRLRNLLSRHFGRKAQTAGWGTEEFELEIKKWWEVGNLQIERSLGLYAYRVLECLPETTDYAYPSIVRGEIAHRLHDIPRELRGLESFTHPVGPNPALSPEESCHHEGSIIEMGNEGQSEMV